ncbi:N-acetyltransferase [Pannus brasiliensis CCIBt3594]|uniref:N-acetyltransferase n=1 Tax=Pannus brasiliensis CCIBt3594 TaxID=1427578 RepID=A0AAW9QY80_9CHRO
MIASSRSLEFREEMAADIAAVHAVERSAFGRENEANLVDILRSNGNVLSFVALLAGQVIGHILYSPVSLDSDGETRSRWLGLAPMAVSPDYQRQGIGSGLITYSLRECGDRGFDAVFVLGHPDYYPRFGFFPARRKGFSCEYPVPDEVFMARELRPGCLAGYSGVIRYRSEFSSV